MVSTAGEIGAGCLVNSAGLFADEVAALLDSKMAQHRIYPVRGEYCELVREKQDLVRGLVYPMPHPDGLSLGLHLTKMTAVGVRLIVESPVRTIETNVYGTQLVLDFASKKKKLVFIASTSEVYGKSDKVPFQEDADLVLGPTTKSRWSYAASKALDEFLTLSYWKEKKQPVIIGRLFNTVGPRQTGRYGMVLPNFVRQAQEGTPITVFGSGQQSRCFCDVRDTVEAILRLVRNDRAVGEVINVGSSEEISIEELAHVVKRRTNSESPITHIPYDQAYEAGFEDMPRRVPCLEKLERLTAFRPATPLSEIIDRVSLSLRHSVAPEGAAPSPAATASTA